MQTKEVSPFDPEVQKMISLLNQHNLSLYPPERCYLDPPETLAKENCEMIGAFEGDILLGIGAVKFFEDYAEIKRMFVPEKNRGKGIAKLILSDLNERAKNNGFKIVRLETGAKFKAAVGLYERAGFKYCEAFGSYASNPQNTYMEKYL